MDMSPIALAALGIVATAVTGLIWVIKFMLKEFKMSIDKNTESHNLVAQATAINTQVSQETLTFMRSLNGRLAQITAEKIDGRRKR